MVCALWFLPLLLLSQVMMDAEMELLPPVILATVAIAAVVLTQLVRAYRSFRFDHRPVDALARVAFSGYLVIVPFFFSTIDL